MDVTPLDAGGTAGDRRRSRLTYERVELGLFSRQSTRDGVRPGDVTGIAAILATGGAQHELAFHELPRARREVQHGRVRPAADNRVEGQCVGAVAEERRLELDLQLALTATWFDQRRGSGEPGCSRAFGDPHPRELDCIL